MSRLIKLKKIFGKSKFPVKYNFDDLLDQIRQIRKQSQHICIVPTPTGHSWMGINYATKNLFGLATFEVPQYYSNQILTDEELRKLSAEIEFLQFNNVVFSGFPLYLEKWILLFSKNFRHKIGVIQHGTFSEMGHNAAAAEMMIKPIQLLQQKEIGKLAAVRQSVVDFIHDKFSVPVFLLINPCNINVNQVSQNVGANGFIQIGVLGADTFNKNLHNQICGASLLSNVNVHVNHAEKYSYLKDSRIINHKQLSRPDFLYLLAQMDVNLHLSFSESWGQLAAESMVCGVPCLVSPNTNILDYDSELKQKLTVIRIDSPNDIATHVEKVLKEKDALGAKCREYMLQINKRADIVLAQFLAV